MNLYYMRDNHTFRPLPLDIEGAVAAVREEHALGFTSGMLCTKSLPANVTGAEPNPHACRSFDEFEPRIRKWMTYVLAYKSPGELEYQSWRPAAATSTDPMDMPLPCDVTVGHGTMRKGVPLRILVRRMKVLYEMATGHNADEVERRTPEQRQALADSFAAGMEGTPE